MITNSPLIPSVKPTLDAIVALARDLVQADVVTIHLYDSRTSTFNLYSGVGAGREFGTPRKEGTSSYIVERGRPVITNNTLKHPQFRDNPFTRSRNVRSAAGFPLLVDDTVSGVLYINYHKPRQLTRARVESIRKFARLATAALENSTFLQVVTTLYQERRTLFASDVRTVLQRIVDNATNLLKIDIVTLYEYDSSIKDFRLPPVSAGMLWHPEIPRRTKLYDDDAAWIVLRKGIDFHFAQDAKSDSIMNPSSQEEHEGRPKDRFVVREGIVSSGILQLKVTDETVGVMFVNFRSRQQFSEAQQALFSLFANQAAGAIQNARAHETVRTLLSEEQKRAQELLRFAQEHSFAVAFAHHMNNVAGTFSLKVEALLQELKQNNVELSEIAKQILTSLEFDASQLEEMARLTRKGLADKPVPAQLDLGALIAEVLKGTLIPENIHVEVTADASIPIISSDRNWLIDVFRTLINNAVEALRDKGGDLRITTSTVDDAVLIRIRDTGIGIPKSKVQRLFVPFATKRGGHLGLALFIARNQITRLGGKLELLETKEGEGTTFGITLPLALPSHLQDVET